MRSQRTRIVVKSNVVLKLDSYWKTEEYIVKKQSQKNKTLDFCISKDYDSWNNNRVKCLSTFKNKIKMKKKTLF